VGDSSGAQSPCSTGSFSVLGSQGSELSHSPDADSGRIGYWQDGASALPRVTVASPTITPIVSNTPTAVIDSSLFIVTLVYSTYATMSSELLTKVTNTVTYMV